jgi:CRP-like cAMP-binding protein
MNALTPMALAREQPFFRGLDPQDADQLASLAREVRFAKDEVVYREGEEFGWTAVLGSHDRVLQARALQDTRVLAFDAARLRALCESDRAFGYDLMRKLLSSAVERLQAVRLEVMDLYWPVARRAGA